MVAGYGFDCWKQYWPKTSYCGSTMIRASEVTRSVTIALDIVPTLPMTRSFIACNVEKVRPQDRPRDCFTRAVTAETFLRLLWTVGSPRSTARVCNCGVKARPTVTRV